MSLYPLGRSYLFFNIYKFIEHGIFMVTLSRRLFTRDLLCNSNKGDKLEEFLGCEVYGLYGVYEVVLPLPISCTSFLLT